MQDISLTGMRESIHSSILGFKYFEVEDDSIWVGVVHYIIPNHTDRIRNKVAFKHGQVNYAGASTVRIETGNPKL